MVDLFKALGDISRLRLLNIISREEMCVCELEVILEMTQTNVSRHTAKLKYNRIVEPYKDAQWTHFRIHPDFLKNHHQLYKYLQDEFSRHDYFIKDTERLNKYKQNNLSCTLIRESRESVIKIIS